jgi:error-prone DNA polymerase
MVNPYLERRQGRQDVAYAHPSLEPVLKRTLGVPLFQEQLLRMAMVVAGFTGGEAEELRRAMGFKRSEKRMREIEAKLRAGMERNGISQQAQEQIVLSITSFALYGFPESHAASFALIAYASAYLKCHYLAAFTAALLNNQPMGFYSPASIVKDAQRHGLKVLPVDVMKSEWECTLEHSALSTQHSAFSTQHSATNSVVGHWSPQLAGLAQGKLTAVDDKSTGQANSNESSSEGAAYCSPGRQPWVQAKNEQAPEGRQKIEQIALRLGLRYVRGLHEEAGQAIARERKCEPFSSIQDLVRRVPKLRKDELNTLGEIGALNSIGCSPQRHRDTEKSRRTSCGYTEIEADQFYHQTSKDKDSSVSPCLCSEKFFHRRDALWNTGAAANPSGPLLDEILEPDNKSPLKMMSAEERLVADFRGTGMTVGPHPMAYHRARMEKMGIRTAIELSEIPSGRKVRTAGGVIARQRPGTAKGFVFLSLEDETGIANAIITPDLFQQNRLLLATEQFLMVEGILQNQDGVISIKAARVSPLHITRAQTSSHDFH